MVKLRRHQNELNGFWQTSELAYRFLLSREATDFPHPESPTHKVLGHLESTVWFPNNQGRIKREDTIGRTLQQTRLNIVHACRTTLLSFYSAFEAYLEERSNAIKSSTNRWGPFLLSLNTASLRGASPSVQLVSLLCADIIRKIRNMIVHDSFAVPLSSKEPVVLRWKEELLEHAIKAGWKPDDAKQQIGNAVNFVVGQAARHVQEASSAKKDLPIEQIYMLHTFTNLDTLAFEIEEALCPPDISADWWVSRREDKVRRKDLILSEISG